MNRTATWRKSNRSGETGDNCVEVAAVNGRLAVRDSKRPADVLMMGCDTWRVFIRNLKAL